MRLQLYQPDERVVVQGEPGTHVYFIVEGQAEVILERHVPIKTIRTIKKTRKINVQNE